MARTIDTYEQWLALSPEDRDLEHCRWSTHAGENRHIAEEASRQLVASPRPVVGLLIASWTDRRYTPLEASRAPLLAPLVGAGVGTWHGGEYILCGWLSPVHRRRAPAALTWSFGGFRVLFHFPPHLCPTCDDDEPTARHHDT